MSQKNVVHVDPDLKDIFPNFLKNKAKECEALERAIERDDWDSIVVIGHKLRGSSAAYGLVNLGKIGTQLEKAAKGHDKVALRAACVDMKEYLANLDVHFDAVA